MPTGSTVISDAVRHRYGLTDIAVRLSEMSAWTYVWLMSQTPNARWGTVEIFGNNISVMELADILGTIPYEILTSVSERVTVSYTQRTRPS